MLVWCYWFIRFCVIFTPTFINSGVMNVMYWYFMVWDQFCPIIAKLSKLQSNISYFNSLLVIYFLSWSSKHFLHKLYMFKASLSGTFSWDRFVDVKIVFECTNSHCHSVRICPRARQSFLLNVNEVNFWIHRRFMN